MTGNNRNARNCLVLNGRVIPGDERTPWGLGALWSLRQVRKGSNVLRCFFSSFSAEIRVWVFILALLSPAHLCHTCREVLALSPSRDSSSPWSYYYSLASMFPSATPLFLKVLTVLDYSWLLPASAGTLQQISATTFPVPSVFHLRAG